LFTLKPFEWLQILLFVGCYSLLDYAYFQIPVSIFANYIYYYGVVSICADLINLFAPLEQAMAEHNHLFSSKADLEIVRGCDCAGVFFLLISAIAVFPAKLSRKLFGMLFGCALIYLLNLLRITSLYFVIAYNPDWFLLIHTYLAPTLLIIAGCIFFGWWALSVVRPEHEAA
jgi:exosortase family protein XrtM